VDEQGWIVSGMGSHGIHGSRFGAPGIFCQLRGGVQSALTC
jgi:hypothetical protein